MYEKSTYLIHKQFSRLATFAHVYFLGLLVTILMFYVTCLLLSKVVTGKDNPLMGLVIKF